MSRKSRLITEDRLGARRNPLCPHPERYHTRDGKSTELEVSRMMGGLVIGLQPDYVVETGTYFGQTSKQICAALTTNGRGVLHTIEIDSIHAAVAQDHLKEFIDSGVCRVAAGDSTAFEPAGPIDLLFIDSATGTRRADLEHYFPHVREGGIIAEHDSAMRKHTDCIPTYAELAADGLLRFIEWPSPRGLVIAQKL